MVAFALVDVVPHLAACETHERPREFSVIGQKGLFQHYLPTDDIGKKSMGTALLHARLALPFSLRIRPPLPGLLREPECDAAGPGNQVRHAEPL